MAPWHQFIPALLAFTAGAGEAAGEGDPPILTPAPSHEPRINGPSVFGVRPGSLFLYTIPASGDRPMQFAAEGLPAGLNLEGATGRITGVLEEEGEHLVVLRARNARGAAAKRFRIVVGDRIALTPPMGWNSWNCWAGTVDQDKVLRSARAMVASGLSNHGWTYINIDDTWQGQRGGPFHGLQGNEKFPDMKTLCDEIHALGLKAGIYSTPWITSYAKFPGGSSDDPSGAWTQDARRPETLAATAEYSFAENDAKQWAEWGFDYLKYDWSPIDVAACGGDEQGAAAVQAATSSSASRTPLRSSTRPTGPGWPIAGGPPATSGTTGRRTQANGSMASPRSASTRTGGRLTPARATGTTRTCWWWATWAGGRPST